MPLTFESAKTWVTENPLKAAGIGIAVVAVTALAVSPKARKMVGLAGATSQRTLAPRRRKKSKKHAKAKSLVLK